VAGTSMWKADTQASRLFRLVQWRCVAQTCLRRRDDSVLELGTYTSPEMPKFQVKADFNADWGRWVLSRDSRLEEPSDCEVGPPSGDQGLLHGLR